VYSYGRPTGRPFAVFVEDDADDFAPSRAWPLQVADQAEYVTPRAALYTPGEYGISRAADR
jgi:hypothetical protein